MLPLFFSLREVKRRLFSFLFNMRWHTLLKASTSNSSTPHHHHYHHHNRCCWRRGGSKWLFVVGALLFSTLCLSFLLLTTSPTYHHQSPNNYLNGNLYLRRRIDSGGVDGDGDGGGATNLKDVGVFEWEKYKPPSTTRGALNTPSVLLQPKGGLGNQLFQYACSYAIARKHELPLYIQPDTKYVFTPQHQLQEEKQKQLLWNKIFSFFDFDTTTKREFGLNHFNIPLNHWNIVQDIDIDDDTLIVQLQDQQLLNHDASTSPQEGKILSLAKNDYCQSEAFFRNYIPEIRKLFSLSASSLKSLPFTWKELIDKTENSVAVHIRRGDFLSSPDTRNVPLSHYVQGINYISHKLANSSSSSKPPTFFVFSDEPRVVEEQLTRLLISKSGLRMVYVSDKRHGTIQDFGLMIRCRHALIGNSTFGWWAAWLIRNRVDKVVVAAQLNLELFGSPYFKWQYKHWYYPREWVVLNVNYTL